MCCWVILHISLPTITLFILLLWFYLNIYIFILFPASCPLESEQSCSNYDLVLNFVSEGHAVRYYERSLLKSMLPAT